MSILSSPKL